MDGIIPQKINLLVKKFFRIKSKDKRRFNGNKAPANLLLAIC